MYKRNKKNVLIKLFSKFIQLIIKNLNNSQQIKIYYPKNIIAYYYWFILSYFNK